MIPASNSAHVKWICECGICEKPILSNTNTSTWPSARSRLAHRICFLRIKDSQSELIKEILDLFESMPMRDKEAAHVRSICAVRRSCKTSIMNFLEKNGPEALKAVFNTVGKAEIFKAKL